MIHGMVTGDFPMVDTSIVLPVGDALFHRESLLEIFSGMKQEEVADWLDR